MKNGIITIDDTLKTLYFKYEDMEKAKTKADKLYLKGYIVIEKNIIEWGQCYIRLRKRTSK